MTCAQIRGQLAAYHEGGLLPVQRRAVAEHVVSCAACQAELVAYDEGDRALRRLVSETPSEVIYTAVLQHLAIDTAQSSRRRARLIRSLSRVFNVAGTLGAAGVVGAVVVALAQGTHVLAGQGAHGGAASALGSATSTYHLAALHASAQQRVLATLAHQALVVPAARAGATVSGLTVSGLLLFLRTTDQTENQQGNSEVPILEAPLLGQADQVVTLLPTPGIYSSPAISPDGRWLAYGVHSAAPANHSTVRGIWVRPIDCRVPGSRLVVPGDSPDMQFKNIRWTKDSRHIVFSVQTKTAVTLYVADARTRRIARELSGWWPAWNQAVSPDLHLLALAGSRHTTAEYGQSLVVEDLATGRVTEVDRGARPVWSPDGAHLAYLAGASAAGLVLMVAEPRTGRHWQVTGAPQRIEGLSWSPDGRSLAYAVREAGSGPNAANQVWVVAATPGSQPLAGLRTRWIGDFTWSPVLHPALH